MTDQIISNVIDFEYDSEKAIDVFYDGAEILVLTETHLDFFQIKHAIFEKDINMIKENPRIISDADDNFVKIKSILLPLEIPYSAVDPVRDNSFTKIQIIDNDYVIIDDNNNIHRINKISSEVSVVQISNAKMISNIVVSNEFVYYTVYKGDDELIHYDNELIKCDLNGNQLESIDLLNHSNVAGDVVIRFDFHNNLLILNAETSSINKIDLDTFTFISDTPMAVGTYDMQRMNNGMFIVLSDKAAVEYDSVNDLIIQTYYTTEETGYKVKRMDYNQGQFYYSTFNANEVVSLDYTTNFAKTYGSSSGNASAFKVPGIPIGAIVSGTIMPVYEHPAWDDTNQLIINNKDSDLWWIILHAIPGRDSATNISFSNFKLKAFKLSNYLTIGDISSWITSTAIITYGPLDYTGGM